MVAGFIRADIHVAVGDFENRSSWMYLDSWVEKIPDYLQYELSRDTSIIMVERHALKTIMDEQALSMAGLADSSRLREVGKLISAQYIITGTVDREDDWTRIDAKLINTVTGKVVTEKVRSKDRSRMNEMVALLGNNLRYQLTGKGSYQTSIKTSPYPTKVFLGITTATGLASCITNQIYLNKRAEYRSAVRLSQFDSRYDSANRLYKTRNGLIAVTGASLLCTAACWLHNTAPDEVIASGPYTIPYAWTSGDEIIVGVQITF
jgi:TolB-like protein